MPEKVKYEDIANAAAPGTEVSLTRIGFNLAIYLLLFLAAYLIALAVFAWWSYPRLEEVKAVIRDAQAFTTQREMQAAWRENVRGLLDPIFTPVLALLSSVIGYIFGKQKSA